ncbi:hypothetical protein ACXJY6_07280 [Vibrio sp. RC27]
MRKTLSLASIALFSCSSFAAIDPSSPSVMSNFSYDYVEARIGVSPTTYGAGLSRSVHPNAHIIASIDSQFDDDYDISAGLAFHAPINNWADFTGEMKLRFLDFEGSASNDSETGMELNLGVRQWLGPQLEVGGNAGYITIDDEDDWVASAYGRFHSTELFSIGASVQFNGYDRIDDSTILFTARFKY